MAKKQPGLFDRFNGLWVRGPVDNTPPDHFSDCLNNTFVDGNVVSSDAVTMYNATVFSILRMALYKPTPPFTGINIPRIIALKANGDLIDVLNVGNPPIYSNPAMKDFGAVNFFGRFYFSPSDGKVGLPGVNLQVYSGSGVSRDAAGVAPTVALTAVMAGVGNVDVGTYLVSYAWETGSGFITRPAPFAGVDSFGGSQISLTNIAVGPGDTAARWVIITKSFPLASIGPLGGPWNVGLAEFSPIFFAHRIADNITTAYSLNFFDEGLVDEADYLFTRLATIPAGVGLLDYKGKLVSYGEAANPSIVRVSEAGEPESFSSTSGFFITDPSDSTGVRSAVEFRNLLYLFKRHRGYVTEDNQLEASTWNVVNFEKAVGTENYGIAAVLDAKGAQSNGFLIASIGALYFFNGTVVEPELSYKIRDLWLRINKANFHKLQVAMDPDNKRIYIVVPLDIATENSHIIFGDYREGLDPVNIKWSLWKYTQDPRSILIYEDFTSDTPVLVTRIARFFEGIVNLEVNEPGPDLGTPLLSYFELAPLRFSTGVSQFNRIRIRATGPCDLTFLAYGEDKTMSVVPPPLSIVDLPGREYTLPFNLVSEQCRLRISSTTSNFYKINNIAIDGQHLWDERPR